MSRVLVGGPRPSGLTGLTPGGAYGPFRVVSTPYDTGLGGRAERGPESLGRGTSPDLVFRVEGIPPRRTLQAGRGAYIEGGRVKFYTRAGARAEAWQMLAEFRRQLPAGWEARKGAVRAQVELVYPPTQKDRLQGEELIPHAVRPDVDNLVKSIMDSMTKAGVWVDDGQVVDLRVRKWRGRRPRWQVAVWFEAPMPSSEISPQGVLPGMGSDA